MRLFKVFIFIISFLVLFLLNSCNENPIDNNIPPCFDCFDFRLTDFEPDWSPDGNSIVHIRYSKDFNTDASEICVMDKNGGNDLQILFNAYWKVGL